MDDTDREWYRRTLGLTRGWTVTDVQHLLVPLEVQVFVEYMGGLSCPVCGSPGRKYDFRRRSWQDLGRAYSVKQALHDIYCLRDPELQTGLFHRVCGYCLVQENERIQAFGRLLERHRDGIVAYFEYRRTNAVSEGTSSGIQTLKAASKGFKDTEVLIAKIYNKYGVRHPSLKNWLTFPGPYHSFVR